LPSIIFLSKKINFYKKTNSKLKKYKPKRKLKGNFFYYFLILVFLALPKQSKIFGFSQLVGNNL